MVKKKTLLMILDGWGIGNKSKADVIYHAETTNMDRLYKKYPHSQLHTSGEDVGLPNGQMGNSEVGHMNIGAGRIIYQDFVRINNAVRDDSIMRNHKLVEAFTYAKENRKKVHFIGLVGNGGVHASQKHLYKLCDMATSFDLKDVYIHALTDGRDTDPKSGKGFINELLEYLEGSSVRIASLVGRYYSMDRDKRWERIREGYDLMVKGKGKPVRDIIQAIQESYDNGITDEFIKPVVCVDKNDKPVALIEEGDVVLCFNFRTDRLRQMTIALTQEKIPEYGMSVMDLWYYTLTQYDENFTRVKVVFDKADITNTLGEIIAKNDKKQIRIAETEKYAHVTFFFSGGREDEFENEKRILIPSPKVATYDLQPEMNAYKVKDAIVNELNKNEVDFICLNFANGDMVGHTGVYDAIIKAVEAVDKCVGEVVYAARSNGYDVMIIADHGNADNALNSDGSPNTAHSLNPVPCIIVSDLYQSVEEGILADVAPTILTMMGLAIPEEMNGKVLVK